MLIMVEVNFKRKEIEKYFGLMDNYLGRGFYTALSNFIFYIKYFISLGMITLNRDKYYLGLVAWVSAIFQWIIYAVFYLKLELFILFIAMCKEGTTFKVRRYMN